MDTGRHADETFRAQGLGQVRVSNPKPFAGCGCPAILREPSSASVWGKRMGRICPQVRFLGRLGLPLAYLWRKCLRVEVETCTDES